MKLHVIITAPDIYLVRYTVLKSMSDTTHKRTQRSSVGGGETTADDKKAAEAIAAAAQECRTFSVLQSTQVLNKRKEEAKKKTAREEAEENTAVIMRGWGGAKGYDRTKVDRGKSQRSWQAFSFLSMARSPRLKGECVNLFRTAHKHTRARLLGRGAYNLALVCDKFYGGSFLSPSSFLCPLKKNPGNNSI